MVCNNAFDAGLQESKQARAVTRLSRKSGAAVLQAAAPQEQPPPASCRAFQILRLLFDERSAADVLVVTSPVTGQCKDHDDREADLCGFAVPSAE